MEVPEMVLVALLPPIQADLIRTPGAKMSREVPKLEKLARASVLLVAPTVKAVGSEAGEKLLALALSLPAATTVKIPAETASATASLVAVLRTPPRDMEMTERATRLLLWALLTALHTNVRNDGGGGGGGRRGGNSPVDTSENARVGTRSISAENLDTNDVGLLGHTVIMCVSAVPSGVQVSVTMEEFCASCETYP